MKKRHIYVLAIVASGLSIAACDLAGVTLPGSTSGLSLSGTIQESAASAKLSGNAQTSSQMYTVVAQSAGTGKIYLDSTDNAGAFDVSVPMDESGNLFMVTIVGPDGKATGPVNFGNSNGQGMMGLDLDRSASFGTIQLPNNPLMSPITPGSGGDVSDLAASDVLTRLDSNGVPIGLASIGKGDDAMGTPTDDPRQACDRDRDGLIDIFDADNDGDGIIDDLDTGPASGTLGLSDVRLSFFMNLKIGNDKADTYYLGATSAVESALMTDTVITCEVLPEAGATRTMTAVRVLATPAPSYIADTEVMRDTGSGLMATSWAAEGYAFEDAGDRFQAFVIPNALINAGDVFTVEITFDDGSTGIFSRMINYVFKTIPRLVKHGDSASLTTFSGSQPIAFDGTKDLTLEFEPPKDETGAYLEGFSYQFEIFYNEAGSGQQLNGDMDTDATFPTAIAGFNRQNKNFEATAASLTLSSDNTYTVTLPKEIFPSTVETSVGTKTVGSYKIDIAAQSGNGDNSAIMLQFEKM